MEQVNAWTELAVDPDELRAIYQALDDAGADVEFVWVGKVPQIEVTFEVTMLGSRQHKLALTIGESAEHAGDRLNGEADVADAYSVADRMWRE